MTKIPVTILGATGVVGQRFVRRLAAHPRFEIRHLAASERSRGKAYAEACAWRLPGEPYAGFGAQGLVPGTPEAAFAPVVFSALDTEPARELEPAFAAAGALVFSNASAFRMASDVPLLIPEVNPEHLGLLAHQRQARGWTGGIICNPNCTATMLALALAPLHRAFGIEAVLMTSLQAVSGAGYPGVPTLDILGNVVPFIRNEEPKVEEELPKLLGVFRGSAIDPGDFAVSALCHRVPVIDGHTEAVSVSFGQPVPGGRAGGLCRLAAGAAPPVLARGPDPAPQRRGPPPAPPRRRGGRWPQRPRRPHPPLPRAGPQVQPAGPQHRARRRGGLDPQRGAGPAGGLL